MVNKNNTVRLTEEQLHQLIESAVIETLNEGRFGDMVKKVGKGLAKGALYTGLTAGGLAGGAYALDKGLENQERYEQQLNRDAHMINRGNEEDVQQWLRDHNLKDNEANRRQADEYFNGMRDDYMKNESKKAKPVISEKRLARIIRENLQRVKKA